MPCARPLSMLLLVCLPVFAIAQPPDLPEPQNPIDAFLQPVGTTRQLAVPDPIVPDAPIPDLGESTERLELHPNAEVTQLLKFGERGFGITDLELQLGMTIPLKEGIAPLKIVPGASVRWWDGPSSPNPNIRPNLPAQVSDLYVDLNWRPRLAKWLFLDLRLTPGFYSDFQNTSSSAFRPRGSAVAIIALSEKFQFLAGLAYINRLRFKLVPAAGLRWLPNENVEVLLMVPTPRVSYRFGKWRETTLKAYLGGEFGGGAWAMRRDDGQDDVVDYSDLRLLSGIEAELPGNRRWYAEFGYVFNRRIDFASGFPNSFRPNDSLLFRVGFTY